MHPSAVVKCIPTRVIPKLRAVVGDEIALLSMTQWSNLVPYVEARIGSLDFPAALRLPFSRKGAREMGHPRENRSRISHALFANRSCPMTPKARPADLVILVATALCCLSSSTIAQVNPTSDFLHVSGDAKLCRPFFPSHSYLADTGNLSSVALGDFNGDGIQDLVADEEQTGNLYVLLGRKNGTFVPAGSFPTGTTFPRQLAVGDFNGDGKLDVAVADGSNGVDILLGNGDGTFQSPRTVTIADGSYFIAAGDFNHDGKLDLAALGNGGNSVQILLGNGDGTFRAPVAYPVDESPMSIAVADFNADGHLDLAVSNWGINEEGNTVSVLLGKGDGTFRPKSDYTVGYAPEDVTAVDLNGDGKIDLATANYADGTASVLINKGDGTFFPARSYPVAHPRAPARITAAKFDAGGAPGLVVGTVAGTYILVNNGDGTFRPAQGYEPSSTAVVAADFNRDGKADLALAGGYYDEGPSGVTILLGSGHGVFPTSTANVGLPDVDSVVVGDFNGDGIPDLVVSSYDDNLVGFIAGLGNGRFSSQVDYFSMPEPVAVAAGDLNGDGKLDLAVAVNSNKVDILLGNGDGTFTQGAVVNVPGVMLLALADLNGDGILDMVGVGGGLVRLFIGKGNGEFKRGNTYGFSEPYGMVIADFNGDRKLDLAILDSINVNIFLGRGDGTFENPLLYAAGKNPFDLTVGDLNGDGILDLATINLEQPQSRVKILLGNGKGSFRPGGNLPAADAGGLKAGDFNGDGKADLAVSSQNRGLITMFLSKGDGTFEPGITSYIGDYARDPVVANLTGDSALDVVVPNSLGGEISVLLNRCIFK